MTSLPPLHWRAAIGDLEYIKDGRSSSFNEIDDDGNTPLHYASLLGQLDIVKNIIEEKKMNINTKGKNGDTPLHCAAAAGELEVVVYLLKRGADFTRLNDDKNTALHEAAIIGHFEVIKYIIDKEYVDINAKGLHGYTLLHWAANKGRLDMVTYLVNRGANVSVVNDSKNTAVHVAAIMGHLYVLGYIFEQRDIYVNRKGHQGNTALHMAVLADNFDMVKFLVDKGADINLVNDRGNMPLHVAAFLGHVDVLRYFIETKNVDINIKGYNGYTSLHCAAQNDQSKSIQYLLENGADATIVDNTENTALQIAENNNFSNIVEYLNKNENTHVDNKKPTVEELDKIIREVFQKPDKTQVENDANTPIHLAARQGQLEDLKNLIEDKHVGVDMKGKWGYTPLHWAAQEGHLESVIYLIKHGADVDNQNDSKETPLHLAASQGHLNVLEYLIDEAKAKFFGIYEYTSKSSIKNKVELLKFLESRGADWKVDNTLKNQAIHEAAEYGDLKFLKNLIENNVHVDERGQWGYTPLHWAAREGYLDIVRYLVAKGAGVNKRENYNNTPLNLAAWQGHIDIVKYLVDEANAKFGNILRYTRDNAIKNKEEIISFLESRRTDGINALESKAHLNREQTEDTRTDNDGNKPIHIAAKNGLITVVRNFIENKRIYIDERGQWGYTPLHWAARKGNLEIVKYLVARGADVNSHENFGNTPLNLAAWEGQLDVVRYLIDQAHADMERVLSYAKDNTERNRDKIISFLESRVKVTEDAKGDNGVNKPIHVAAKNGQLSVLRNLIEKKHASIGERGEWGYTPLHWAAREGYLDIVRYLVARGADVNKRENFGNPSLNLAAWQGHLDVVRYLIDEAYADMGRVLKYAMDNTVRNKDEIISFLESRGARVKRSPENIKPFLNSAASKPSSFLASSVLTLSYFVYSPYKMISSLYNIYNGKPNASSKQTRTNSNPQFCSKFSFENCAFNNVSLFYVFQDLLDKKCPLPTFSNPTSEEIMADVLNIVDNFEDTLKYFNVDVDNIDFLNLFNKIQVLMNNGSYSKIEQVLKTVLENEVDKDLHAEIMERFERIQLAKTSI